MEVFPVDWSQRQQGPVNPILLGGFYTPKVDLNELTSIRSGGGLEITSSVFELIRSRPVEATRKGIRLNLNEVEKGVFYQVEYEGEKYAIRVTEDGMLERYSVE